MATNTIAVLEYWEDLGYRVAFYNAQFHDGWCNRAKKLNPEVGRLRLSYRNMSVEEPFYDFGIEMLQHASAFSTADKEKIMTIVNAVRLVYL